MMSRMAMSRAMIGMPPKQECGVNLNGRVSIMEHSRERVRFRVEADLLDMSRLMMNAGASACQRIQAALVEHADFTVTLPYRPLYASLSSVKRENPTVRKSMTKRTFPSVPVSVASRPADHWRWPVLQGTRRVVPAAAIRAVAGTVLPTMQEPAIAHAPEALRPGRPTASRNVERAFNPVMTAAAPSRGERARL